MAGGHDDEDVGRSRRGRILSTLAVVLLVVAASYGFAAHRGANQRLEDLEARLEAEFGQSTRADLDLPPVASPGATPEPMEELALATGERPSEARWDQQEAVARYDVSYWTESRCVIVTWSAEEASFRSFDGGDCTLS